MSLQVAVPAEHSRTEERTCLPAGTVLNVDTAEGAYFRPSDGTRCDASLASLRIPAAVPGHAPCAAPHELYVIVDTSGSTRMQV